MVSPFVASKESHYMRKISFAVSVVALAALVGCNQETVKTSATAPGGGTKALNMTAPKGIEVTIGADAKEFEIEVERGGFDDAVKIEFSGLPAGVEVVEKEHMIAKGVAENKFHLRATESAKPVKGQSFKITASSSGMSVSKDVALTVNAKDGTAPAAGTPDTKQPNAEVEKRKEELRTTIKARLDATDQSIKALEEHQKKAAGEAKQQIDNDLADLRKRRADLQNKLDNVDNTKPDAWDDFQSSVKKAADELGNAVKRATDRIKN